MTQEPKVPSEGSANLLRNFVYLRWLAGNVVSLFGDQFYFIALPWMALSLAGGAGKLGAIMTVGSAPRVLLMLIGGAVADRVSTRRIMIIAALIRGLCLFVAATLLLQHRLGFFELCALALIFGAADAFALPAQLAYLPAVLPKPQLSQGLAMGQVAGQIAAILAPGPAGLLIASLGPAPALLIDGASFIVLIGVLATLPNPFVAKTADKMGAAIAEGLKFVVADTPLLTLIILLAVINFGLSGPLSVGLASLIKSQGGSPVAYGILLSAMSVGSIAGVIIAGGIKSGRRGLSVLLGTALLGGLLAGLGFAHGLSFRAGACAAMGVVAGFLNIRIMAFTLERIPQEMRGRVTSVLTLCLFASAPVSMAVSGAVFSAFGVALFYAAGVFVVLTAILAAFVAEVRKID